MSKVRTLGFTGFIPNQPVRPATGKAALDLAHTELCTDAWETQDTIVKADT